MDISVDTLINIIAKLPGMGPRSARRVALHLISHKDIISQLINLLGDIKDKIVKCRICDNIDLTSPCSICSNSMRDSSLLCIVESVSDIWAIEKSGSFKGKYHVLGGVLSALHNVTPDDLNIPRLVEKVAKNEVEEVVLALGSTLDAQTTAFYIVDRLKQYDVLITRPSYGIPMGANLEYIDDGTMHVAFQARNKI